MASRRKTNAAAAQPAVAPSPRKTKAVAAVDRSHTFVQNRIAAFQQHLQDIRDVGAGILNDNFGPQAMLSELVALAVNCYNLAYDWLPGYGGAGGVAGSGGGGGVAGGGGAAPGGAGGGGIAQNAVRVRGNRAPKKRAPKQGG